MSGHSAANSWCACHAGKREIPARPSHGVRLRHAALLVLIIALAGCAQPAPGPTEEPSAVARAAYARFLGDLYDPDGQFAHEPGFVSVTNEATLAQGGLAGRSLFERGMGNVTLQSQDMHAMGTQLTLDAYCDAAGYHAAVSGHVYWSRPVAGHPCGVATIHGAPPAEANASRLLSATRLPGGIVRGVFAATIDGRPANATVEADPTGRPASLTLQTPDAEVTMRVQYGERRALAVPRDTDRLPADVKGNGGWGVGGWTWSVEQSREPQPLTEFHVRLVDANGTVAATFALTAETQRGAGYAFTFHDADGDGRLTAGDSAQAKAEPGEAPPLNAVVWDDWADKDLGQHAISLG